MATYRSFLIVVCFFGLLLPQDSNAATVTYTYDSQNRLTQVGYSNGSSIDYTYDAAGNRLTQTRVNAVNNAPAPTAPAIITAPGTAATSQVTHHDPDTGDTHT